jgi:regulator of sigma D
MPFIADFILPDSQMERQFKIQKRLFKDLSKIYKIFNNLNDDNETVALFENSKLFTEDDIKIMKEGLQEQFLLENKESLVAKIKDSLNTK